MRGIGFLLVLLAGCAPPADRPTPLQAPHWEAEPGADAALDGAANPDACPAPEAGAPRPAGAATSWR